MPLDSLCRGRRGRPEYHCGGAEHPLWLGLQASKPVSIPHWSPSKGNLIHRLSKSNGECETQVKIRSGAALGCSRLVSLTGGVEANQLNNVRKWSNEELFASTCLWREGADEENDLSQPSRTRKGLDA